jgi:hypothetical protein
MEARETAWAIARALHAAVVYALRLVEASAMEVWRIEVVANTGVATTRRLRVASAAVVWLQQAAFERRRSVSHSPLARANSRPAAVPRIGPPDGIRDAAQRDNLPR